MQARDGTLYFRLLAVQARDRLCFCLQGASGSSEIEASGFP